jgi:hypothetical protein
MITPTAETTGMPIWGEVTDSVKTMHADNKMMMPTRISIRVRAETDLFIAMRFLELSRCYIRLAEMIY